MICFPNAKINLGLNVLSRRHDGYHDIDTVIIPLGVSDILEIIPGESNDPEFSQSGIRIPGPWQENLSLKACRLFAEHIQEASVKVHLHKVIPPGSGLGGGSSDAAHTLHMLNELFQAGLSTDEMLELASTLGSDCPFFILNRPVHATGRGERMKEIPFNLPGKNLVLVLTGIHVSTQWAYSCISPRKHGISPDEVVAMDISTWKENLFNDFEVPVFKEYPRLKAIRDKLYGLGAIYAAMSGSGSAIYGVFNNVPEDIQEEYKGLDVIVTRL